MNLSFLLKPEATRLASSGTRSLTVSRKFLRRLPATRLRRYLMSIGRYQAGIEKPMRDSTPANVGNMNLGSWGFQGLDGKRVTDAAFKNGAS
nr:hypothetical protein BDOA9_0158190 [Bradyrhizobium sp. DOA9]